MIYDRQTSSERMKALLLMQKPDRVPFVPSASDYSAHLFGISLTEFYLEPEKALQAQIWALDLHQHDGGVSLYIPHWAGWDLGGKLEFSKSSRALMPILSQRPVEKAEDIDSLVLPNPDKAPAGSRLIKFAKLARQKKFPAIIYSGSPMVLAASIIDPNLLMRWFYKQPTLVHRILRIATDYLLLMADRFITEFGAEHCAISSSYPLECHALISPQIFKEFSLPYIKETHSKLLAKGITSWRIHLCGDHTKNLKYWMEEIPLAPRTIFSIGHEMDMQKTAQFLGAKYIVAGNVPTTLLQHGTPNEVMEVCREQLMVMKHSPGGYILSSACALPPLMPPVNVHAMLKAARLYGQYD